MDPLRQGKDSTEWKVLSTEGKAAADSAQYSALSTFHCILCISASPQFNRPLAFPRPRGYKLPFPRRIVRERG